MECTISIDRSVHYDATPTLWSGIGVALEWHRSASQICKLTLQRHSGVALECSVRVAVMEWQESVHSGVALKCTLGVALEWQRSVTPEWHWSASQICKLTLHCHSGVVMEW